MHQTWESLTLVASSPARWAWPFGGPGGAWAGNWASETLGGMLAAGLDVDDDAPAVALALLPACASADPSG